MSAADEDDYVERAEDDDVPEYTPLEAAYLEKLLDICDAEPGVVSRTIKMLEVVKSIDIEILCAKAKHDALAVAEYTALRAFIKGAI